MGIFIALSFLITTLVLVISYKVTRRLRKIRILQDDFPGIRRGDRKNPCWVERVRPSTLKPYVYYSNIDGTVTTFYNFILGDDHQMILNEPSLAGYGKPFGRDRWYYADDPIFKNYIPVFWKLPRSAKVNEHHDSDVLDFVCNMHIDDVRDTECPISEFYQGANKNLFKPV